MRKLLALDLSTKNTGFAVFDLDTELPIEYGGIKPEVKLISKMKYPEGAYHRMTSVANKINDLVLRVEPEVIIIEEVNRGINRIAQKSLDALHFFVLDYLHFLNPLWLPRVIWKDSNGRTGWRGASALNLKQSDADKDYNKKARAFNKSKKRKTQKLKKLPIIDWKVLAERYVRTKYGLDFDVVANPFDSDTCDALCVGSSYFLLDK